MIKLLLSALLLFSLASCDNCTDIACTTPPAEFTFQLINEDTGLDLFLDSIYSPEKIEIINIFTQKK